MTRETAHAFGAMLVFGPLLALVGCAERIQAAWGDWVAGLICLGLAVAGVVGAFWSREARR